MCWKNKTENSIKNTYTIKELEVSVFLEILLCVS